MPVGIRRSRGRQGGRSQGPRTRRFRLATEWLANAPRGAAVPKGPALAYALALLDLSWARPRRFLHRRVTLPRSPSAPVRPSGPALPSTPPLGTIPRASRTSHSQRRASAVSTHVMLHHPRHRSGDPVSQNPPLPTSPAAGHHLHHAPDRTLRATSSVLARPLPFPCGQVLTNLLPSRTNRVRTVAASPPRPTQACTARFATSQSGPAARSLAPQGQSPRGLPCSGRPDDQDFPLPPRLTRNHPRVAPPSSRAHTSAERPSPPQCEAGDRDDGHPGPAEGGPATLPAFQARGQPRANTRMRSRHLLQRHRVNLHRDRLPCDTLEDISDQAWR